MKNVDVLWNLFAKKFVMNWSVNLFIKTLNFKYVIYNILKFENHKINYNEYFVN